MAGPSLSYSGDAGKSDQAVASSSSSSSTSSSQHLGSPSSSLPPTSSMSFPMASSEPSAGPSFAGLRNPPVPRIPASPPTPAPSPRPRVRARRNSNLADESMEDGFSSLPDDYADPTPSLSPSMDAQAMTRVISNLLTNLPSSGRVTFISDLLLLLNSRELAHISSIIAAKLRIDFLSALPIEISLHILSYIDDPLTLARAGQVSRFWRSLVNDEHTWEAMCLKYRYRYRRPSIVYPRLAPTATPAEQSGSDILASLYRRYRQRGLDPSNARNELRTLHDLFLTKQTMSSSSQDGSAVGLCRENLSLAGTGSSATPLEMSATDLRFYEQLEQIVQEESRERYGVAGPASTSISLTNRGDMSQRSIGSVDTSSNTHLGWLSAGNPAPPLIRSPAQSRSRLPHLTGVAAQSAFQPNQAARTRVSAALPGAGAFTGWTSGLAFPWGLSDLINLPASIANARSPLRSFAALPGTASAPPPSTAGSSLRRRHSHGQPRDQRTTLPGLGRPSQAAGSSSSSLDPASAHASKSGFRATTFAGMSEADTFSYKNHFKRNYMTESNWHRGGRTLTHHVSTESGCVCTCVAMDNRWLIIGMANGKIHLFDARTGLYERTLSERHESGVWCLALVSKTRGTKRPRPKAAEDDSKLQGKGKQRAGMNEGDRYVPDPSGKVPFTTPNRDLKLTDFDTQLRVQEAKLTRQRKISAASLLRRQSEPAPMSNAGVDPDDSIESASHDDQTLHWFHRARKALQGEGAPTSSVDSSTLVDSDSNTGSGDVPVQSDAASQIDSSDRIEGVSRDVIEAGPEFVADAIRSYAQSSGLYDTPEGRAEAQTMLQTSTEQITRIRQELGISGHRRIPRPGPREGQNAPPAASSNRSRPSDDVDGDTDMDGLSEGRQTPMSTEGNAPHWMGDHPSDFEDDEDGDGDYDGFSIGIGGSANGLGTLCGSSRGHGNDGAVLVSGGCDRDLNVWDLETGTLKFKLRGHGSTVRSLRVLDGRPIAISGGRDSTVRVWNIETGQQMHVLAGHQNSVRCLEVAGNRVATGSYDCTCRIWDVDTGECLHVLRGHYNQIYCIGFDGNKVATGSLDSTVRIWNAHTGEPLALLQGHTALVGSLQLSNSVLISGGSDGRILAYSLVDHKNLYSICAHDNSVSTLQFDEHFILTGGNDGHVRLWNLYDGSFIRELVKPTGAVWKVAFRDDKVVVLSKKEDESLSMEVIDFRPVVEEA